VSAKTSKKIFRDNISDSIEQVIYSTVMYFFNTYSGEYDNDFKELLKYSRSGWINPSISPFISPTPENVLS
jgi:hypothetical protein